MKIFKRRYLLVYFGANCHTFPFLSLPNSSLLNGRKVSALEVVFTAELSEPRRVFPIVCVCVYLLDQVSVIQGDLRDVDLSEATVVVIYLLPEAIAEIAEPLLIPLLQRDKEGSNAISPRTRHPPGHWSDKGDTAAVAAENGQALESNKNRPPCRIVCNTWGIPGARVVREASVGLYGGVTLRLFTSESLPRDGEGDDCGRA